MAGFAVAGVVGWPVAHSRSPVLHGFWLREHGIAGAYVPLAVRPGDLAAALRGLAALGMRGCNVTVPHKEAAAGLVDALDPAAAALGSVNLVTVWEDGSLHGASTDGAGFLASLDQDAPGWRDVPGPAVVLGAGGAARAIVAALRGAGRAVRLLNRTRARAEALAGAGAAVLDWAERDAALAGAALLVNTTTQGMADQPKLALDLAALPRRATVCDIVYVPLETPLLAAARARGNPVVPGLGMLLHQARPAFAAFYGVLPEVTPALRAAVEATLVAAS
jgi:shikimate dehydrogenase